MRRPDALLPRLLRDEAGATVVEYGLILGVLSLVVIAAAANLGGSLNGALKFIAGKVATS